jgi:hypothetical protein
MYIVTTLTEKQMKDETLGVFLFFAWAISSWLTHIIYCFGAGKWGFLIAGALCFPIAWGHGTYLWFH